MKKSKALALNIIVTFSFRLGLNNLLTCFQINRRWKKDKDDICCLTGITKISHNLWTPGTKLWQISTPFFFGDKTFFGWLGERSDANLLGLSFILFSWQIQRINIYFLFLLLHILLVPPRFKSCHKEISFLLYHRRSA